MIQNVRAWFTSGRWRRPAGWLLGVALVAVVAFYVLRAVGISDRTPVRLVVYAFSTQEDAFSQGIFPAFEQAWEAESGQDLAIEGVFGASGTLAGQINLGAPADVAVFSNAEHVDWLKVGKRVRSSTVPAIVGCTPIVVATRTGNPLQIAGYADLARPGLRLVHPDPRSSGAGQWGVLAAYGAAYLEEGDAGAAQALLGRIWENVRLLPPSARAAMSLFELGAGDALVTYEQDALRAQQRGVDLEIVIPARTVVAQHAVVVVDDNVTRRERAAAEDFVQFLLSEAGQQILGELRLRPPDCQSPALPALDRPFSVEELGGWSRAYDEVVLGVWQEQIEPALRVTPGP